MSEVTLEQATAVLNQLRERRGLGPLELLPNWEKAEEERQKLVVARGVCHEAYWQTNPGQGWVCRKEAGDTDAHCFSEL